MDRQLVEALRERLASNPDRILGVDPGETSGWALLQKGQILRCGEVSSLRAGKPDLLGVVALLEKFRPTILVMERFGLYAHKSKQQFGSSFPTVEVIGVLRLNALILGIPVVEQSAGQAKGFLPSEKLRALGYWTRGQKHARDAIRHVLYYALTKSPQQLT